MRNERSIRSVARALGIHRLSLALLIIATTFVSQSATQTAAGKLLIPQPSQAKEEAPPAAAAPAGPQPIALPEISGQADELERLLREMSKGLAASPELLQSTSDKKAQGRELTLRAEQTEELLSAIPSMLQLQDEERYWRNLSEQYSSKRKRLTTRAATIEEQRRALEKQEARWQLTYAQVHATPGLEVVSERVQRELDAIQKVRAEAEQQLKLALTLQNELGEQERQVSSVLIELEDARRRIHGHLLSRDSEPLWSGGLREGRQSIGTVIYFSAARGFTGTEGFLQANETLLFSIVLVYALLLGIAFRIRRAATTDQSLAPGVLRVLARPYSIALLLTLLTTVGITMSAPSGVAFVICIFYVIPVVRLLPLLIEKRLWPFLYALCGFYTLEWVHVVLQSQTTIKRGFFAIIVFAAIVVFGWLSRPAPLRSSKEASWKSRLLLPGIRVGLVLLICSLGANIFGFVSLAQILGVSTLFSGFTFAVLYTVVRVLDLQLQVVTGSRWLQSLPNAQPEAVRRWASRLFVFAAFMFWLNINLSLFTVRDAVSAGLASALQYQLGYGKVQVALGDLLNLALFLLIGYFLAKAARFVLEELVLPRLSVRGGLAYAFSRVTYYVLLLAVFVAALANAGVELNKLTVITGALSLGVGFGLQNIVNNFASGLIILFERPFRVGDTVEVGGVLGTVKRIGARSSTVLTFQYAEVIVPNSNLLSNQVINWTLTSARRRVEVPVGVAYGTDPEVALKLLVHVAEANPRIMNDPKPEAFFLGFGDSALNLELRFWAAQSIWFELKSEVGLAVYRALTGAGIEIPFPQRDLHLRGMEAGAVNVPVLVKGPETAQKKAVGK